ncbi:MAG: PfkB family carbohydrate kinase, partial [Acidobacteriota bacterium]|nr:PfkB family carbohydrate kinase [Acidobacteriota bacterium]MDH3786533.1 PfkB family carbohydrate kinase [Acidobacteriota bacterium]
MSVDRLVSIVREFAGTPVAVVGDFVADEFIYGDIARVSREAPVLVLNQIRTEVIPGGGANSVANLSALGAHVHAIGVVGNDASGRSLLKAFDKMRVNRKGVRRLTDYATPTKARILAGGIHTRRQQIVRLDRGSSRDALSPRTRISVRSALRDVIKTTRGVLVADYGYGAASPDVLGPHLKRWSAAGTVVTVDSRTRIGAFHGITACTPNQEELEVACGIHNTDDETLLAAARRLRRKTSGRALLVTRGARGMTLLTSRKTCEIPAYGTDEVADVTGAGDTVIAAFTLATSVGAEFEDAARLANYAAGIVVTRVGTATATPDQLIAAIREDHAQ